MERLHSGWIPPLLQPLVPPCSQPSFTSPTIALPALTATVGSGSTANLLQQHSQNGQWGSTPQCSTVAKHYHLHPNPTWWPRLVNTLKEFSLSPAGPDACSLLGPWKNISKTTLQCSCWSHQHSSRRSPGAPFPWYPCSCTLVDSMWIVFCKDQILKIQWGVC